MDHASVMPNIPPMSPWDAYILILIIPFIIRLIFVAPPLLDLINTYAPPGERTRHIKWFLEKIKRLPIRGFWLIVINEILSFILPAIIALVARYFIGPIGWNSWADTPDIGLFLLLLAGLAWVFVDFGKISRSRIDIKALSKYNLETTRRVVDTAVTGREILQGVSNVEIPRPWQRLVEPNFILNAISQVLDVGADALDLALDQVKSQAVEVVDKIDEDIQTKVTERAKASTKSLIRTTLFSLFPLLVLVGLQQLIQH
ncbi:MAG: hypothetical protein ACKVI6_05860 [Candidatus Poseidoniales archaeon]|jgi:hypothetical protein|tara:strand:- start:175 stop:948 length:774 start_codon:yes stop_codon:yes gene_type:complete